jgi:hypothetical protein
MLEQLKKQFEYYFSKDNLAKDRYLREKVVCAQAPPAACPCSRLFLPSSCSDGQSALRANLSAR